MIVANTKFYNDLPFEDYLKMPGISYSFIKNDGKPLPVSDGMRLGTRVHNYLLEPDKYDWQQVDIVKTIAAAIRTYVGQSALSAMACEVAFTADFIHNGMRLPYKGRVDLIKIGKLIIDLKVLAGSLATSIKMFGYDRQVSGYCIGTGCEIGLIISYNKKSKIVETSIIKPNADFWEYQCVYRGIPN